MPGSHCPIFKVFGSLLTLYNWVKSSCFCVHMTDQRQGITHNTTFQKEESLICLQSMFHKQTHSRIDTINNVRSHERQVFLCENGFIPVKNNITQKAHNPSCLYTDLQWKKRRDGYLQKSCMLMFCYRSIMTPPTKLSFALYRALSLASFPSPFKLRKLKLCIENTPNENTSISQKLPYIAKKFLRSHEVVFHAIRKRNISQNCYW